MGYNIWEYIIQKRVFNSRQQLYLTKNITSAFSKSGFKDYSVFYRNYIKYIGLSPSADLRQLTEKKEE
jgi:AraC-like DNA-binding protein